MNRSTFIASFLATFAMILGSSLAAEEFSDKPSKIAELSRTIDLACPCLKEIKGKLPEVQKILENPADYSKIATLLQDCPSCQQLISSVMKMRGGNLMKMFRKKPQ